MTAPTRAAGEGSVAVAEQRRARLLGDDPLATLLVQHRLLPAADVERCFEAAGDDGAFLEEKLLERGLVTASQLRQALESQFFCPSVDLTSPPFEPELLALVPRSLALKHLVFPLALESGALRVALAEPGSARVLDALAHAAGMPILPAVALRHELRKAVESCYGRLEATPTQAPPRPARPALAVVPPSRPEPSVRRARSLPVDLSEPLTAVNSLLRAAVEQGATDVHFEPGETGMAVRFRVDGILHRAAEVHKAVAAAVTSRLKVLGRMDITERRVPQDGRASLTLQDKSVDLRISSLPAQFGEKVVIRLLRKDTSLLDVDNLHMPADVRRLHGEMVDAPMGLFLVTGPTGSGKTTTLYATLGSVDRDVLSVVTLEDPIEYSLPGITQVQIHEAAGMTFAAGLHSILRQDPDVILVGEIRDVLTAEIACRAALTGHKVLSTLHTNDSCQAVTRLLEMGLSSHLVTATLRGVMAQRLLRRICVACRRPKEVTETDLQVLQGADVGELSEGGGCDACSGTGYRGRMAVYEYFRMEQEYHRLVLERASPFALRQAAKAKGMTTMLDAARAAVREGLTTTAEIQRILLSDDVKGPPCPGCGQTVSQEFSVCPFCERVLRDSCTRCGQAVEAGWAACSSCGTPIERRAEREACGRCEAPLDPAWVTCPYCGERAP